MSALDQLQSVDRAIAEMKRQFEAEKQAIRDECNIAKVENELFKAQIKTSRANELLWQRIATQFLTQFDMVDKICADVKAAALAVREQQEKEEHQANTDDEPDDLASAMQTRINEIEETDCPDCGAPPGTLHTPDCPAVNSEPIDLCVHCLARTGEEHKPDCPNALPEFLRGNDNTDNPPDNAKLDPEFVQPPLIGKDGPEVYAPPRQRSSRLLKRPSPTNNDN